MPAAPPPRAPRPSGPRPRLAPSAHACGKVILLGEHAVVHGFAALAAGLPNGLSLTSKPLPSPTDPASLRIACWDLDLALTADSEHPVARAALAVLTRCDGPVTGVAIEGHSTLPARAGLGSSASLSVALARLASPDPDDHDEIVAASLEGERVFHGQPSGIDNEVAARGGIIRFVRGEPAQPVRHARPIRLVIAPSGQPRSTKAQVEKVSARRRDFPSPAQHCLEALGAVTQEGQRALEQGEHARLGELMNMAHGLLSSLDVSAPVLDRLCDAMRGAGALGAKLTGAGGGGCAIALVDEPSRVLEAVRPLAPNAFFVEIQS